MERKAENHEVIWLISPRKPTKELGLSPRSLDYQPLYMPFIPDQNHTVHFRALLNGKISNHCRVCTVAISPTWKKEKKEKKERKEAEKSQGGDKKVKKEKIKGKKKSRRKRIKELPTIPTTKRHKVCAFVLRAVTKGLPSWNLLHSTERSTQKFWCSSQNAPRCCLQALKPHSWSSRVKSQLHKSSRIAARSHWWGQGLTWGG